MIVSIHQPNYIPYPGYFNKIYNSDIFVLYDTAQYVKNQWHNRNRIRTLENYMYLTIPLKNKDSYLKKIIEVPLPQNKKWMKKHWMAILGNYSKSNFFSEHSSFFENLYSSDILGLSEFNEKIITYIIDSFGIRVEFIRSSSLNLNDDLSPTELLIEVTKKVGGTKYLSGPSGLKYLDTDLFEKKEIELLYQDYQLPEYKQRFPGFIPNLSSIDLLFNTGRESIDYIKG